MNKIIKNIILIIIWFLCILIILYLKKQLMIKSNLYQEIMIHKNEFEQPVIDGEIINNMFFIPGVAGLKVDVKASYLKMKKNGYYNEQLLVYQKVVPSHSIANNKLPIISGNKSKKSIAIISKFSNDNFVITKPNQFNNYPHLIKAIHINSNNYINEKKLIAEGDIVYLENDINEELTIYLINYWNSKGLKIISLNDLLSE